MSVLCFLFPHGTYLKRVDLPPPPPQNIQSNKKNLKRYLQMPVELLLFLFLVRQVRLQNGGVLVGTLQFCDCSRYHDGISTGASHERGRPLTPSVASTQPTTLKKKATLKTPGKQDSPVWRNNIRGNRVPTTPSQNMEIKNNSIRATSPRSNI